MLKARALALHPHKIANTVWRHASTNSRRGGIVRPLLVVGVAVGAAGAASYAFVPEVQKFVNDLIPNDLKKNYLPFNIQPSLPSPVANEPPKKNQIPIEQEKNKSAQGLKSEEKKNDGRKDEAVTKKGESEKKKLVIIHESTVGGKPKPNKVPPTLQERQESVLAAIASTEEKVREATKAKTETVDAVDNHVNAIRSALSAGIDAKWDDVRVAHLRCETAEKEDAETEADARNYVDSLRLIVDKNAPFLADHPLLASARATIDKFEKELDEMSFAVRMVESERIFAVDFAHLVQDARQRFTDEIRAVVPTFDWDGHTEMKKRHLNALLTHAHIRIDQLRREMIEMRLREEERVGEAIRAEKQKVTGTPALTQQQIENEVKQRLADIEKAHAEKVEQVIKAHNEISRIEKEEAIHIEKQQYSSQLSRVVARLKGVETALEKRAVLDAENRASKQLWIACQNMADAIEFGNRSGNSGEERQQPLRRQAEAIKQLSLEDPMVETVLNAMRSEILDQGTWTRADLKKRFDKVYEVGRRVSFAEPGSGTLGYIRSWIRSILTFNIPILGKFDPVIEPNHRLLDTALERVAADDLLSAARLLLATNGECARLSSGWASDCVHSEEAALLTRLLLTRCFLISVLSTY